MISLLYPRMYFSPNGEGEGGTDEGEEGFGGGNGGETGDAPEKTLDPYVIEDGEITLNVPVILEEVDVSTISGNKYLSSLVMPSNPANPLINGIVEGSIPAEGLNVLTHIIGDPGAKFYLNIVDIDDDEILNISNAIIQASGKYTISIPFPKSSTTNKYKINLRVGDGTRINPNLPTTDPMWTIHQYADPTVTFTRGTGTATGVTYSGDDATLTAKPYTEMGVQTSPFQLTKLINSTTSLGVPTNSSTKLFGEFEYAVTAAKGGALVYIKASNFEFTNDTIVTKIVEENVVSNDIVQLNNIIGLSRGMQFIFSSIEKTKLYNISSTRLKLSGTKDLVVGMILSGPGVGDGTSIVSIDAADEITISTPIYTNDKVQLDFDRTSSSITIKFINTDLNQITLIQPINLNAGTLLSFKNNEMRFRNNVTTSGSGSASTTLTNTIRMSNFGSKDVTFTLPTDDIFTLTPNAHDQEVDVIKETATTINVLAPDKDDNSGSKTPSTVRSPVHGVISGSYGSGDGTITYTPAIGYVGKDSFTFKVNDGTTDSDVKTIFITVNK